MGSSNNFISAAVLGCQSCSSWSAEQGKLIFPCPRACLRIWSRETGSAVPSRVSLLISILRLNLVRHVKCLTFLHRIFEAEFVFARNKKSSLLTSNFTSRTTLFTFDLISLHLVSGYECGRVFPASVGPGSPSRDAANWLLSRFSLSVETLRRYGWLRMVFPGARLFRAPLWCPSGGWRHARSREHCRGEPGSALSGGYAPGLAKAEGSSIVYESGEGWTPVRENHRLRHHGLLFIIYFLRTSSAQGGRGAARLFFFSLFTRPRAGLATV